MSISDDRSISDDPVSISLVGSTGSIGTQTLDVVRAEPERFQIVALAAHSSVELLVAQAREFRPRVVAVTDPASARKVSEGVPSGTEVISGPRSLIAAASIGEVVVNAVVGFAGLPVTLTALSLGKRLALANKESLIAGGPVVRRIRNAAREGIAARKSDAPRIASAPSIADAPGNGIATCEIIPIDSEHGAIHQCLRSGAGRAEVARVILTASGGPFRGRSAIDLLEVQVEDALSHPTWQMGPKITVDSSTLMNKGLEVIEAHELFDVDYDQIEVVIHPQSVVHSMVEFTDGATVAQLSMPDMRLPIGYALGYPLRISHSFGSIDWAKLSKLEFEPPDRAAFPCLALAEEAGRAGGLAPAWLNAGNEVAVEAFLAGKIPWSSISEVVADTLQSCEQFDVTDAEGVIEADGAARRHASACVERFVGAR